jgi:hypothetical protein
MWICGTVFELRTLTLRHIGSSDLVPGILVNSADITHFQKNMYIAA